MSPARLLLASTLLASLLALPDAPRAEPAPLRWPDGATLALRIDRAPTAGPAAVPSGPADLTARARTVELEVRWPAVEAATGYRLRVGPRAFDLAAEPLVWRGPATLGDLVELSPLGPDGRPGEALALRVPGDLGGGAPSALGAISPGGGLGLRGGGLGGGASVRVERPAPPKVPPVTLRVVPGPGALSEPHLRPIIFRLREDLARCRPTDSPEAAPHGVSMEVAVGPAGRARAWMTSPDKRNLTVAQWQAARPIGECLSTALGGVRWPPPADGEPGSFTVELRWL